MELVQQGHAAQDFTQAMFMLRGLSPTAVDQELRALQVQHQSYLSNSLSGCEHAVMLQM